jgi:hypothetical protein
MPGEAGASTAPYGSRFHPKTAAQNLAASLQIMAARPARLSKPSLLVLKFRLEMTGMIEESHRPLALARDLQKRVYSTKLVEKLKFQQCG